MPTCYMNVSNNSHHSASLFFIPLGFFDKFCCVKTLCYTYKIHPK